MSAHNAYVVSKDRGHAYHQWATFHNVLEDLATDIVGETRADRDPRADRAQTRTCSANTLAGTDDCKSLCP